MYFAEMCDADVADEIPGRWIEDAERRLGAAVPARLSEAPLAPGPADEDAREVAKAVGATLGSGT